MAMIYRFTPINIKFYISGVKLNPMLAVIASICLPITLSLMAYIPYKYPFNNKVGEVTKVARFFGLLVVLSILFGGYLAWDNYSGSKENKSIQTSLNGTIISLNHNIKSLSNKIDSIGYKIDQKTGLLVPKIVKHSPKVIPVIFEKELTNQNANEILRKIMAVRKKDTITNKSILYYITEDSNLRKFSYELERFLKKKSFIILGPDNYGDSLGEITITPVKGFYKDVKIMQIVIGTSLTKGNILVN